MANTIHVDIVSAEGEIYSGTATMVFAPAIEGELGIAPRHAPLLTNLRAGEVRVQTEAGEELHFYVGGGALEVQPYLVTVLADTALRAKCTMGNDKGTYRVDARAFPAAIDVSGIDGPNKGRQIPAIYELTGDDLTVCYDLSCEARPKSFHSPPGSKLFLVKYRRA